MKHLKNIRPYLALCLMIVFAGSCSDWLDGALPKDKNLEDDQFTTEKGINSVLNGIYRGMADVNLYGGKLTTTDIELLAHYYYYNDQINISSYSGYTHFYYLSGYQYEEMQNTFSSVWSKMYSSIFQINTFIKHLEQASGPLSEDKKNVLLGEAYGLRAFLHFDLYRLFGDKTYNGIPYNDSPEVLPHDFKTPEEVFSLILKDIAKATDYLKNDPILTSGIVSFYGVDGDVLNDVPVEERFAFFLRNYRMNYYAVQALKARVLMNKGDVHEAAEIALNFLDKLQDSPFAWADFNRIVITNNPDYIFYSEVIFGIPNPDLHSRWRSYTEGSEFGKTYAIATENLQGNIFRYDLSGGAISSIADGRARQWTPSRLDGQYVSRKFDNAYVTAQNNPKQYFQPLMRISELLYIVAESRIIDGNIPEAMEYINRLLTIRGVSNEALRPTDASASEALNILETEYYKEFYGEGQTYFYLKRRNSTQVFRVDAAGKTSISYSDLLIPVPLSENIND